MFTCLVAPLNYWRHGIETIRLINSYFLLIANANQTAEPCLPLGLDGAAVP